MCPRSRDGAGLFGAWHDDTDPWGLAQAFQVLDRDGNGTINCEDLSAFFGGCVGQTLSAEEAASMIALADLNGDGVVGLEEFLHLMSGGGGGSGGSLVHRRQEEEQAAMRAVFDVLDVNKDGKLGREDLRHAMAMSGQRLSEEELDAMVAAAAAGMQAPSSLSSASISFDTFSKLMSSF